MKGAEQIAVDSLKPYCPIRAIRTFHTQMTHGHKSVKYYEREV